ncbi:MAG: ankyrin repeat domain-containing protein [Desulfomonilaceae bacterium]
MANLRAIADQRDYTEGRELIDTAQSNDLDTLGRLLRANKPIDFRSGDGKNVLRWACEAGRLDVMKLLVEHGAPIEMVL